MFIIRKKLTPNEISPPNVRTNPETGVVEQTFDAGASWVEAAGLDPRHNDLYRRPALTGEDARCNGAARIVGAWQEALDRLNSSVEISVLATTFLQFLLLFFGGAGILIEGIFLVLAALIGIGVANINAAFTPEVWEALVCIVYNHLETDGQMTNAGEIAIMSDISSEYPGTVYDTLVQLQNLFGSVLASNATTERTETGECISCVCDCADIVLEAGIVGTVEGLGDCKWRITGTESHRGATTDYEVFIQRVGGGTFKIVNFEYVYGSTNIDFTAYDDAGSVFTAADPMGQCAIVVYYLDDDPDPVASGEWQAIITVCEC